MKLLLLTPKYFPTLCGNTITVERIKKKLEKRGVEVEVVTGKKVTNKYIQKIQPDIVHAFHARKSNIRKVRRFLTTEKIPYIITLTGTDVNVDIKDKEKKKSIKECIQAASCVTAFDKGALNLLKKANIKANKTTVIPQGKPLLEKSAFNLRKHFKINKNDYVITLIAGIRPVKDIMYAIKEIEKVAKDNQRVRLIILGETNDVKYYKKIQRYIKKQKCTFIHFGKTAHSNMYQVYKGSNLIINTSVSEGMSTVLVEAQFVGTPILAAGIPGNSFLPKRLLFPKREGALTKAINKKMNKEDKSPKKKQQKKNKQKMQQAKDNEVALYIKLYKEIL